MRWRARAERGRTILCVCWVALVGQAAAGAPPAGYYNSVDATSAETLRRTLHEIIDDHTRVRYTSDTQTDTWDVLKRADEDPGDGNRVLDVYRNASYVKAEGGNANYNREHSWPKSHGFPDDGPGNYPFTDCHHLFLSDSGYNSSRSNKPYGLCAAECSEKPTEANGGQGGGAGGAHPGTSNWTRTGTWETWAGRRGDVARALFYMDVRYAGGTHGVTGHAEPDLVLTDDLALVQAGGDNRPLAHMGRLSTLIEWHKADPVDDREGRHNEAVFEVQGNRNPFVDNPAWAACVFEGQCGPAQPPVEPGTQEELLRAVLERIEALERELAELKAQVQALGGGGP